MFTWLSYEESLHLKESDNLVVNQNIHGVVTSTGQNIRFWSGDEVVFIKSLGTNKVEFNSYPDGKEQTHIEHQFLVRFKNDDRNTYGEFTLNNLQVNKA